MCLCRSTLALNICPSLASFAVHITCYLTCAATPRTLSSITTSTAERVGSGTKSHFSTLQFTSSIIIKQMQGMFWYHAVLCLSTAVPKFLLVIVPRLDGEF